MPVGTEIHSRAADSTANREHPSDREQSRLERAAGAPPQFSGFKAFSEALNEALRGCLTFTVGRNITAAPGSALGCQPPALVGNSAHPCEFDENGHSVVTVGGNVTGTDTVSFLLNGVTVNGNVTFTGDGSNDIPWSIKNNTIGGNLTVTGVTTEWLGVMFNKVGRNVTLTNIRVNAVDPGAPGVFIVRNTVQRNLTCTGLTPGVSGGFLPGSVNVVGGNATGQCAALV